MNIIEAWQSNKPFQRSIHKDNKGYIPLTRSMYANINQLLSFLSSESIFADDWEVVEDNADYLRAGEDIENGSLVFVEKNILWKCKKKSKKQEIHNMPHGGELRIIQDAPVSYLNFPIPKGATVTITWED